MEKKANRFSQEASAFQDNTSVTFPFGASLLLKIFTDLAIQTEKEIDNPSNNDNILFYTMDLIVFSLTN